MSLDISDRTMKRFFALASFALALSIVLGTSDQPEVIEANVGNRIILTGENVSGKVKRCTIEMSDGKIAEFYPVNNAPGFSSSAEKYCELDMRETNRDYAGIWTLTTVTNDNKSFQKKFALILSQKVSVNPTNYVWVNAGQWATVWFDGNDTDITACKLKATMRDPEYDLLNGTTEGLSRYRGCGVRMPADEKNSVQWELSRKLGNYVIEKSIFSINVLHEVDNNQRVINHFLNLGQSATLEIDERGIFFCQFTRPDGSLTDIQYGGCKHEINSVTQFHRGIWRASYATKGKIELNRAEIHVQTWDLAALNATQVSGTGQEIHLLCRTGVKSLKFCSFIRPDRHVIHLPVGVGNDNYSYYGDGYEKSESRRYGDCGLTIHKPSAVDFGLWFCEMGILNDNREIVIRGTVIDVVRARAERTYKIDRPRVTVKRGDPLKIRCTVNALLDYCWLTSPNGTIYSVLPEAGSDSSLTYDGKGFAMGDCSAIVGHANASDDGDWICHLGISGSTEVEDTISVEVTDSYLIATKREVYENHKTKLSCQTFLGEDGTLQYCRWVRPNGHGINQEDVWRYETITSMDRCELTILEFEPEDIGRWTCVAKLFGGTRTEQWATIDVRSMENFLTTAGVVSIVLGSGLLIVTLIGSFFVAMYIYKRRKIQGEIKRPPPYDPEDYEIPRVIQSGSNQPIPEKDYKY